MKSMYWLARSGGLAGDGRCLRGLAAKRAVALHNDQMVDYPLDRLEGASSSATLDYRAQTIVFEHFGSVTTAEQKAASPLAIPLGAIASVECQPGSSTNWFWVVRRGHQPWAKGVWSDPCGVVCSVDPTDFAERVRYAVMRATPVDADTVENTPPAKRDGGWRKRLARGVGRAAVDGLFNTR